MNHPSSLDLESFAVGEPLAAAHAAHVEACGACTTFVEQLRGLVASSPAAREADAAVARALAEIDHAKASTTDTSTKATAAAARRRRVWVLATSVVAPLAAAAAILLLARAQPASVDPITRQAPVPAESPPDRILMGTLSPPQEPDTQFKGGMQVAVVRERGGRQERFSSTVRVRPGDRLRVEVALDQEQAILGAVLADDGTYVELMPQGTRGPGTHFSERSAKVDAAPTRGTIVIGSPEAVARARATRQLTGVSTLRVEWEAP